MSVSRKKRAKPKATPRTEPPVFLDQNDVEELLALLVESAQPDDSIQAAQNIMYDAWDATGRRKRIALAQKALQVSPLCADAYVLLAQEKAKSAEDALALFRMGAEVGKQALGSAGLKEYKGHFWGALETRPYMRALHGLGLTLSDLGQHQEAIDIYREMLRLNPNDNQGIRYLLAESLLARDDITPLKKLLKKYKGDASAQWLYTQALLAFRDKAPNANALAEEAWEANSHVPDMLSGDRPLVQSDTGYIRAGGDDEASFCVEAIGAAWRSTPGAIAWLKELTGKCEIPNWHSRLADK
ncbi:MAG TPA: hypothetical protein VL101_10350 [Nordella sp.]|nr:hypothetical protein [Nordella sp.]